MKSVLKKVAGIAIAAAFAVGMAGCTIESDSSSHKHTFATDYSSNATHHWYAATCGHKDQVKDKAEHTFEEWSIRSQPSEDAEGKKERKCSDCQYLAEEAIAKLDHVHAKGTLHAAVASTCKTKGTIAYYDCTKAECEIKLDSDGNPLALIEIELDPSKHESTEITFETIDAENHKEIYKCCNALKIESEPHVWDDGKVTKEPTTTEEGVKTFTCTAAKKILVFCQPGLVEEALGAGATFAGSDEYIEKVKGGWLDFDIVIATPDMMKDVGRLGMVLGRKGLMPNPKNGTVTIDIASAINKLKQGHVVGCGQTKTEPIEKLSAVPEGLVLIPAGTFQMGSNQGRDGNKPVHTVTISKDFYICDHEVTQKEYEAIMETNPSYFIGEYGAEGEVQENCPVEMVSWYMAIVYCNKRSIKEGLTPCYTISGKTDPAEWGTIPTSSDATWNKVECNWTANGYRLPTEAEWEYAARAGDNTVDALVYSGTNAEASLGDYAWYVSNAGLKTHEVKKKKPNAKKLYDMSGNVWEWCWDLVETSYYSTDAVTDPRSYGWVYNGGYGWDNSSRIYRGGGCCSDDVNCAVSYRGGDYPYLIWGNDPLSLYFGVGFRVVRNAN